MCCVLCGSSCVFVTCSCQNLTAACVQVLLFGMHLHNEELSDLYSLPNIVRVVKSKRMRWAGHVACIGEGRGVHRFLVRKPEGKRPLGRPRCRWRIILRWILRKWEGVVGTGWSWLRIGTGGGHL